MYDGSVNHWFDYRGERYQMFYHLYNLTHLNERCVELAIADAWLKGRSRSHGLEVGNVLSHYGPRYHQVWDLYERRAWHQSEQVYENFDILNPPLVLLSFDWVLSLSTIEHTADPPKAIDILHGMSQYGLVTFPTGVVPALDEWLEDGAPGSHYTVHTIVREQNDHGGWAETSLPQVRPYGPWGNGIAVLEWGDR